MTQGIKLFVLLKKQVDCTLADKAGNTAGCACSGGLHEMTIAS